MAIERHAEHENLTPRQVMVLRFWDRTDLQLSTHAEVSAWIDAWYADDPDRLAAWEAWKASVPSARRGQGDPYQVPVGVGEIFLAGLQRGTVEAREVPTPAPAAPGLSPRDAAALKAAGFGCALPLALVVLATMALDCAR